MFLSTEMFLFAEGFLSAEVSLSIGALLVTDASLSMEALRPVEESAFRAFTMSPSAGRFAVISGLTVLLTEATSILPGKLSGGSA